MANNVIEDKDIEPSDDVCWEVYKAIEYGPDGQVIEKEMIDAAKDTLVPEERRLYFSEINSEKLPSGIPVYTGPRGGRFIDAESLRRAGINPQSLEHQSNQPKKPQLAPTDRRPSEPQRGQPQQTPGASHYDIRSRRAQERLNGLDEEQLNRLRARKDDAIRLMIKSLSLAPSKLLKTMNGFVVTDANELNKSTGGYFRSVGIDSRDIGAIYVEDTLGGASKEEKDMVSKVLVNVDAMAEDKFALIDIGKLKEEESGIRADLMAKNDQVGLWKLVQRYVHTWAWCVNHELGHHAWKTEITKEERRRFWSIWMDQNHEMSPTGSPSENAIRSGYITRYAVDQTPDELFCEHFALECIDPELSEFLYPELHKTLGGLFERLNLDEENELNAVAPEENNVEQHS